MLYPEVHAKLTDILANARRIDYNGIVLYLISNDVLQDVLQLELKVRSDNIENGIEKKNHFYDYAKIINSDYPAFKYTLSMKHKKKEIFDPLKVKKALPAEYEIWKNKSRSRLNNEINDTKNAISDSQALILRQKLEHEIQLAKYHIDELLANFHDYEVVISTFEDYTYYPALYFVVEEEKNKNKPSDTHLRQDVPNLLWFQDNRPYSQLRSNDRMSRIIQSFHRICDSVYFARG